MYLTVALLKKRKACRAQVDLFAATFPDGVHATEAVCISIADTFDFQWAVRTLLPPKARAEYDAKRAPILAEYRAGCAAIWAEYDAKRARIWEYGAKCAPIEAAYKKQRAALFGRIASTVEN